MNMPANHLRTRPAIAVILLGFPILLSAAEEPFGLDQRMPWTTSRVVGSPDPPLPYTVEKTFTKIAWKAPIYVAPEPSHDSLLVVQQGGEKDRPSRILRVPDDPATDQVETLLEISGRLVYSLAFHPGYRTNGQLLVFSNGPTGQSDRTNRISRFTIDPQAPHRCDPTSEEFILEWPSSGHDGGEMVFGQDQMLYIATGDGTSDSDGRVTGQDLSDLAGGVLRIDADHPQGGRPYSVPADNPFTDLPGARPELWAYGLRNPWRLTIDRETGQIWAGNNGQDLWETAHLIRRGENYGWSVYEGSHPFYLNRPRGPTPHVLPTIEHPHSEFRSLTGGVVYYGDRFPELSGVYVYGDYSTGRIWGGRHDGRDLTWHRELANTPLQIVSFAVDHRQDLLIVDLAEGIYRLIPAPKGRELPPFPKLLSETGLFLSTADHRVDPALIPYSVNAPGWVDSAECERFIALPGQATIERSSAGWKFPEGSVLMQTLSLESAPGRASSRHRIETRLLTLQQGQWAGYSFRWNIEQTDAALVDAKGQSAPLTLPGPDAPTGTRLRDWRFPSRAECLACHSRAANFVLGLADLQMNREHNYDGRGDNQLRTLEHIGAFSGKLSKPPEDLPRLVDPYDASQELETRARSYLHANCSVCHVEAGGGNSQMELSFKTPLDRMKVLGARPQHDTLGIDNAMLIAPGDPDRSVLYQRVTRRGPSQMPPLVSGMVDQPAAQLLHDWIKSMTVEQRFVRDWKMEDLLPHLEDLSPGRSFKSGQAAFRDAGCIQCHRCAGQGGSVGPDLTTVGQRLKPRDLLESILLPSKVIAPDYAVTELETKSGLTWTGRVEGEEEDTIVLRPVTAFAESVRIQKADLESRKISLISNMPAGMINSLEKNQVLDLLAYLIAEGRPDHSAWAKP